MCKIWKTNSILTVGWKKVNVPLALFLTSQLRAFIFSSNCCCVKPSIFKALRQSNNSAGVKGRKLAVMIQIRSLTFKKASCEGYLRLKASRKTSESVIGIMPKELDLTWSLPSLKKLKTRSTYRKFPREAGKKRLIYEFNNAYSRRINFTICYMKLYCNQIWKKWLKSWSTCPIVFGCWLLDHVIYLKLRER